MDVPPDNTPVMTAFLLLAMIMGEGVANMMFFAEGNALGLLGAVLVAMGISAVNILGGFTAGLALVRLLNAREWWWKLAGALSLLGALASLAIGHFAAAVYRQVRHSDPAIDITAATSLVAERIRTLDGTSLDLVSLVMMGIGLVLGLLALWKGFHYGHEYPGYARRYRRMAFAQCAHRLEAHDPGGPSLASESHEGTERWLLIRDSSTDPFHNSVSVMSARSLRIISIALHDVSANVIKLGTTAHIGADAQTLAHAGTDTFPPGPRTVGHN